MKLIVNADDFGYSPDVNDAVVHLFRLGMIDRTTAIVNMPYFAEGCRLAAVHGFKDRIGLHFNMTEGEAVDPLMAATPRFCSSGGTFTYTRNAGVYFSPDALRAVRAEFEQQIRLLHEEGVRPAHMDSHRHVHTEWFIFQAVEPALRRCGITSVRIAKNIGRTPLVKNMYKTLFNRHLEHGSWQSTAYFGSVEEVLDNAAFLTHRNAIVEVMTHPTLDSRGVIVDALSGNELLPQLEHLRRRAHSLTAENAVHDTAVFP
jgi:chitin disaccharide deacetylase